ncbi:MAG: NAD(P)H-hydrate dehydratase, partial [Pedobacter sp.]
MQNLLTAVQMQDADAYTIGLQKISSIDLMENAAKAFVKVFLKEVSSKKAIISICCGQGNNGGDGLAIARLLKKEKYKNITVFLINFADKQSDDYAENLKRIKRTKVKIIPITQLDELRDLACDVIVDAVLGSGLNKPLKSNYAGLAKLINNLNAKIIAVDVPTGFNTENEIEEDYIGVKADLAICFQRPKINFFMPESAKALVNFEVVKIGIDEDFIEEQPSFWKLLAQKDIQQVIKPRAKFTHKGTYGHALIIAGNENTMGAALLAASSCLHTGAGLTTVCLPQSGLIALNTLLPEVMALPRNDHFDGFTFEKFSAIAIGPGLGLDRANLGLLEMLINLKKPLVIDADGLTILSKNRHLLPELPKNTVLTPHLKEFDRLFGEHTSWWQRIITAREKAQLLEVIIVLKNQYTFICLPTGEVRINSTGNAAMASGGMGDVLTGIITSLLAQSYRPAEAATLGVYLHGKSG